MRRALPRAGTPELMGSFTLVEALLIFAAGLGAGAINAAVGSGTLITFPALVAFGVPPQTATMSNALGLILSLIHISEPTRQCCTSRMPSSA